MIRSSVGLGLEAGLAYGAEPGTASEDGLRLLASWSATHDQDAGTDAINQAQRIAEA